MTRNLDDKHDRRLSAPERAELDRLRPALQAWQHYLDRVPAVAEFLVAEQRQAPIVARHCPTGGMPGRNPLIVNPRWALNWAQGNGFAGRLGTGSPLSFSTMVSALDYMAATRATTIRARVDDCDRRRRPGYFHLTLQLVERIRGGNFTPVLTRRPGRPRAADRVQGSVPRAVHRGDDSLTIVRHWLQVTEPTALLSAAREQGRPLAIRPGGRPVRSMHRGAQVRREFVVGRVETLVAHAIEFGQWRLVPVAEMAQALAAHAAATPDVLAPVVRFSTPDAPGLRNLRGWWRFTLSAFGRPLLEPADLAGEVEHYVAMSRQVVADPAPTVSTGFVLPPGTDPAWLEDPGYRVDVLGMSDDDYARWKEGG